MAPHNFARMLADSFTERVFVHVAKSKVVQLQNLLEDLEQQYASTLSAFTENREATQTSSPSEEREISRERVENALDYLEQEGLVGKQPGPIPLLNTFHVTTRGMEAQRKLDL